MALTASPRRRGLSVLAGALLLGGLFALFRSPALRVGSVRLEGAQRLPAAEYQALAGVRMGDFLWDASPSTVAQRLQAEAWVKTATVKRQGNSLAIQVAERQPIALYPYGQGYFLLLDEEGVILGLQQLSDGLLPVVSGTEIKGALRGGKVADPGVQDALTLLGWMAPELRGQVSQVAVESERRLTLYLTGGATVRWGRLEEGEGAAQTVAAKLSDFGGYWQKVDKAKARGCIIDMRVAGRLIPSGCE